MKKLVASALAAAMLLSVLGAVAAAETAPETVEKRSRIADPNASDDCLPPSDLDTNRFSQLVLHEKLPGLNVTSQADWPCWVTDGIDPNQVGGIVLQWLPLERVDISYLKRYYQARNLEVSYIPKMTRTPANLNALPNLETISINYNASLVRMRPGHGHPSVTTLNLIGNHLNSVSKDIDTLFPNLRYLNLEGNYLKKLPEAIGKLKHLNLLHVRDNLLTTLPKSVARSKSLGRIDASYNKITHLPHFGQATNLRRIDLMFNHLRMIPKSSPHTEMLLKNGLKEYYRSINPNSHHYVLRLCAGTPISLSYWNRSSKHYTYSIAIDPRCSKKDAAIMEKYGNQGYWGAEGLPYPSQR